MDPDHKELSVEEVREELKQNGAIAIPGEKVLTEAGPSKVFSGKKEDGGIWIVRKTIDGYFFVEYTMKRESSDWN